MLVFVRTAFDAAQAEPVSGGQKRSAPEAASSAAPAKRPAIGLGGAAAAPRQPPSLDKILEDVKSMPTATDKPVRQPTMPLPLSPPLHVAQSLRPSVCEPHQEMEYSQKESLLGEINELEENAVNGVIEIIKVAESIVDDSEIDLGELQSSTMWKVRLDCDNFAAAL